MNSEITISHHAGIVDHDILTQDNPDSPLPLPQAFKRLIHLRRKFLFLYGYMLYKFVEIYY